MTCLKGFCICALWLADILKKSKFICSPHPLIACWLIRLPIYFCRCGTSLANGANAHPRHKEGARRFSV
eukprot:6385157-Amphidinium_carterae.1